MGYWLLQQNASSADVECIPSAFDLLPLRKNRPVPLPFFFPMFYAGENKG